MGNTKSAIEKQQPAVADRIRNVVSLFSRSRPSRSHQPEDPPDLRSFEASFKGWFWATGADGRITYISQAAAELIKSQPQDGELARLFVHADEDISGRRTLPFLLARHAPFEDLVVCAVGCTDRYWSLSGRPQFDASARFVGYRGSAVDVTEHRQSSEIASQLAHYDALTGLPNRRRMGEILQRTLRTAREHNRASAILLIDLDRFKQVNDTLGHPAGDQLLKLVAERLVDLVGDKERVFRLGGDEFQIIVPNSENRGIVGDLATDTIRVLSQPYFINGSRCVIGASVGIAVGPLDGEDRDKLIRSADLALYASKAGGRGKYRFFSSELLKDAEDLRALEEDLREALAQGQLDVFYQPIVNARSNRMTGVESLVRWHHPKRGAVSPALFIPIAEEAGLIGQIGEWVLRRACEDAVTWPGELRVAVNVSPLQFSSDGFPATVLNALATSQLPAHRLELEITEGVFLNQSEDTSSLFKTLKEIGVRLALDDFGTGYSALGYLRNAPFDKIKIDQSFVRAATSEESTNSAIISAIVALAEALDMETTAEGVEFMDQLYLMRELRVSHAQGWVYSKAVSSEELKAKLEDGLWTLEPSGLAKQRSERQTMYKQVGVIHGARYDQAIIRNLSETGALIDGIEGLSAGMLVVIDFGDGQLTFAHVIRSADRLHGIAFVQPLIEDGAGGLCSSHRVAPTVLAAMGLPNPRAPIVEYHGGSPTPLEKLAGQLGLTLAAPAEREALPAHSPGLDDDGDIVTFRDLSARYLQSFEGTDDHREQAKRDLRNHVLPRFGQLRLEEVSEADLFAWLAAKVEVEAHPAGTDERLHGLLNQIWSLAVRLGLPGAEPNPLEGRSWGEWRAARQEILATENAIKLLEAACLSSNRQLKFVLALLMTTGVRPGELLKAEWANVDLEARQWILPEIQPGRPRQVRLTPTAILVLEKLPRWSGCRYLLPNPLTKKVYRSVHGSWEAAKRKAGLPHIELDDLRHCELAEDHILSVLC